MQPTPHNTVAIVDDDQILLDSLHDFLEAMGIHSKTYLSADIFLASGDLFSVGCVVTDVKMAGTNGLDLLKLIKRCGGPPVCMMTSFSDKRTRQMAKDAGAKAFLEKPLDSQKLINFISRVQSHDITSD